MYDEQIKRLRELPHLLFVQLHDHEDVIYQAADVIEEMSRRETPMEITEIHVDEYFCPACGAENNCDQSHVQHTYCPACGQRLLL